eukprot:137566-Amphidinium_carterae.1
MCIHTGGASRDPIPALAQSTRLLAPTQDLGAVQARVDLDCFTTTDCGLACSAGSNYFLAGVGHDCVQIHAETKRAQC